MKIKSGVWHWLAAGCGLTGLLVGMGIEGGAQLGGVITDGEVCTALGLLAAAVVFMRLGFADRTGSSGGRRRSTGSRGTRCSAAGGQADGQVPGAR